MTNLILILLFVCGEEDQKVEPSLVNEQIEQPAYPPIEKVKQVAPDEDSTSEEIENTEKVEETTSQEETETQGD
jgi:hypothetical protein